MGDFTAAEIRAAKRGLTKIQRMYVKDGSAHGDCSIVTIRSLIRKGIFYIEISSPNGKCGFARLTQLGKAVSDALPIEAASPYLQPALRAALTPTPGAAA